MELHNRALRVGALAVALAIALKLAAGGYQPLIALLAKEETQRFLLYLETGRVIRPDTGSAPTQIYHAGESPAPAETALPVFTADDAAGMEMTYRCSLRPDLESLMDQPLSWDLYGSQPTVLILHTHTTESYTQAGDDRYQASSAYRTLDEGHNMIAIGDALAEYLAERGIVAIHDRSFHDYPSYSGSYTHARETIEEYLQEYPSIQLVLDLHRDASGEGSSQLKTHATVDGADAAQLMLVVGTNATRTHPNWQENLALALKFQRVLESLAPGITRPINLRSERFNQDLLPGVLLVEVGAAGNTRAEALAAVAVLGDAIVVLARGST